MATREEQALDQIAVADRDNWADGPPHEDFKRLRRECVTRRKSIIAKTKPSGSRGDAFKKKWQR